MIAGGLTRRTFRKATSSLAIAVSFAMLVSLISVASGLYELSKSRFEGSSGDLVVSSQGLDPTIPDSHLRSEELLSDSSNYSAAMPILTILGRIGIPIEDPGGVPSKEVLEWSDFRSLSVGMIGIVPQMTEPFIEDGSLSVRSEQLDIDGWFPDEGDPFYEGGYEIGWTGEVILDENIMRENGLMTGSIVYVLDGEGEPRSSFIVIASVGTSLTGGGIVGRLVGGVAIFHLAELQYASGQDMSGSETDRSTALYLKVDPSRKDPEDLADLSDSLSTIFPGHMISTEEGRLYRLREEVLVFEIFAVSVGLSALLVGMMFLSTVMLIEQEERASETALLRALGVSKWSIYRSMLAETLLLAGAGAALGAIPGIVGSRLLDQYLRGLYGLDISFVNPSFAVLLLSAVFLILNVLVFSTIPGVYILRMEIRSSMGRIPAR